MVERSALKSVLMARLVMNSVDHQISFHTPPLTESYLCFRGSLLCSNKRMDFLLEQTASCLSFSLKSLNRTVQMTNIQRRSCGPQIPRVSEALKDPLGINIHMMPSPEIHPGLHCLELTSLHHSVDN